ncbi:LysE family translocator [Vibrio fluvialis]|jgi:threonine/homoserine/homoserine lactone efflux protein|uniref:LysE family translocator n=1 Tax=Vibrio fluvialis TaxID=676 RepID=A0AAX2LY91_VIBFL|nr:MULTISPECIES: LysE family translocator [Vibrio]TNF10314.1 MAG: LysE family translocator [Vibrionaceae bacterium]HDM8033635.1 LysE family translocator [Vibrio fluvialis clinical-1]AMF92150.1 LysE family translocator [Vibrio fluvialis]AVH33788.1 LysE family translocator [Vibrio fluvialis]EKO3367177.1 LysE family translocator [Vibrio fluvialis]
MTFTVWLSLFTICILGAMSPGPSLAMVAKHSLAGGRKNGLATAWAHAFGIGVYAFITLIGLAVVLHQSPLLFKTISYAGAFYLAYLGLNALRSKGGVAAKLESGESVSVWQSAREGLMISLLSPKIALFFIALFSQFVAVGNEFSSKALIVVTPFVVDGLWYTFITFLLSSPRLLDKLRARAVLIDRLSGVVLIALALRVVMTV